MKIVLSVLTLAGAIVYFYFVTGVSTVEVAEITGDKMDAYDGQNRTAGSELVNTAQDVMFNSTDSTQAISKVDMNKLEESTVALRYEIDGLIQEFDANLSDPEMRKNLKLQINEKMAEYNLQILPIAMNTMKNSIEK